MNLFKRLFCIHDDGLYYKDYRKGILIVKCSKCKRETSKLKKPKYPTVWYHLWAKQQ